jgi:hypothetical protein
MSITDFRLQTAAFPDDYAQILIETLAIQSVNFLNVKDALYQFRRLDDDQAAEAMERIADLIERTRGEDKAEAYRCHRHKAGGRRASSLKSVRNWFNNHVKRKSTSRNTRMN